MGRSFVVGLASYGGSVGGVPASISYHLGLRLYTAVAKHNDAQMHYGCGWKINMWRFAQTVATQPATTLLQTIFQGKKKKSAFCVVPV